MVRNYVPKPNGPRDSDTVAAFDLDLARAETMLLRLMADWPDDPLAAIEIISQAVLTIRAGRVSIHEITKSRLTWWAHIEEAEQKTP